MAGDPNWYVPVCDRVLVKIKRWYDMYERGTVSATRSYMEENGRLVDKAVKYGHVIRFTPKELDHLIRLMDALSPHPELTNDFRLIRKYITNGRLYPGGEYEVSVSFFKQDLVDVLDVLVRAKTGKLKTMDQVVQEQKEAGKGMFEL